MTFGAKADEIGSILLDRAGEYVPEEVLADMTRLPGYGVRWYIFQLREAGFLVETAMYDDREAFRRGARGWRLVGTTDQPYRPAAQSVDLAASLVGVRFDHPEYGRGTITVANDGAPKIVAKFPRRPRVVLDRSEIRALVLVA